MMKGLDFEIPENLKVVGCYIQYDGPWKRGPR